MLTIALDFPDLVKKHDEYKNYKYVIVNHKPRGMNFYIYCWYIKLPENHPLNSYDYEDISISAGDPTWREKDSEADNYWLGFDCLSYSFMTERDKWSIEFFEPYIKATIECLINGNFAIYVEKNDYNSQ